MSGLRGAVEFGWNPLRSAQIHRGEAEVDFIRPKWISVSIWRGAAKVNLILPRTLETSPNVCSNSPLVVQIHLGFASVDLDNPRWIWKLKSTSVCSNPPRLRLGGFEQTSVDFSQILLASQTAYAIAYKVASLTNNIVQIGPLVQL